MRERDSKSSLFWAEKKRRILPLIFMVISLCALSFYLGGAFFWEKTRLLDETKGQNDASKMMTRLECQNTFKQEPFPECNITMQDSTPCTDLDCPLIACRCEAFSTYPRTYDLLHADGLFDAESHRCEMKFVMLEMDRILRPAGYAMIRDSANFLDKGQVIGEAMRWNCHRNETENGSDDSKALLVCQKSFWSSSQLGDSDVDQ